MYSFDFGEIEALQARGEWDAATRLMVDAAQRLERGGADLLLICSNTMHRMAGEVEAATGVPLLHIADPTAERIAALLAASERPVIYAGGGVIASGTSAQLVALAEALDCPVALTMMGLGAMPDDHPLLLGPLGMHGAHAANVAVNEADLVLALGVRFDDRVIGDPASFARYARIVHVDVDAAEIGKNKPVTLGVHADLRDAFAGLLAHAKRREVPQWHAYLRERRAAHPLRPVQNAGDGAGQDRGDVLTGVDVITALAALLPREAVVTTGVGQHQMWAMQHLRLREPHLPLERRLRHDGLRPAGRDRRQGGAAERAGDRYRR